MYTRPVVQFVLVFVPVFTVVAVVLAVFFVMNYSLEVDLALEREADYVKLGERLSRHELGEVRQDLRILAESASLREYLDTGSEAALARLQRQCLALSRLSGRYDQVRYLDASGDEVVRVNHSADGPRLVAAAQLQNKGQRYYFTDTWSLPVGAIFVSPLDLNVEQGAIERPLKPMLRFGTPVADSRGHKRGILVLNYFGAHIIDNLAAAMGSTAGDALLVNRDGYWLLGPRPEDAWGFMFEGGPSLASRYPEVWSLMQAARAGQVTVEAGVVTWQTVFPLSEDAVSSTGSPVPFGASRGRVSAEDYFWKVATHVPSSVLAGWWEQWLREGSVLLVLFLLPVAGISAVIVRLRGRERTAREATRTSEERQRAVIEHLAEGLLVLDADARVAMCNPEGERLLGWPRGALTGEDACGRVFREPGSPGAEPCPVMGVLVSGQVSRVEEERFWTRRGAPIPVAYTASPYVVGARKQGVIVAFEEISTRKRRRDELTLRATHDGLTGLYNRAEIETLLEQAFKQAQRYGHPLSVCMIDVDHFKAINDQAGHQVGDAVLARMGRELGAMMRDSDICGRYGGEEFLAVLTETPLDGALHWAEQVRRRFAERAQREGDPGSRPFTVSIGVAATGGDESDHHALVARADAGLYQAKGNGRNRVAT